MIKRLVVQSELMEDELSHLGKQWLETLPTQSGKERVGQFLVLGEFGLSGSKKREALELRLNTKAEMRELRAGFSLSFHFMILGNT